MDLVFRTMKEKYQAIVDDIKDCYHVDSLCLLEQLLLKIMNYLLLC